MLAMSEAKRAKTDVEEGERCMPASPPKKALANTGKDDMIALRVRDAISLSLSLSVLRESDPWSFTVVWKVAGVGADR